MHLRIVVTVAFIGMLALPARAQLEPGSFLAQAHRPEPAAYALEGLGAVGIGVAVAALPALVTIAGALASMDDGGSKVGIDVFGCLTLAAYSAGSGLGAVTVGRALNWDGNADMSYGMAFIPTLVGVGALIVSDKTGSAAAGNAAIVTLVAGPPILATVGYNIGVTPGYASSHSRLEPPSSAARLERSRGAEHRTVVAFDARLLNVRF